MGAAEAGRREITPNTTPDILCTVSATINPGQMWRSARRKVRRRGRPGRVAHACPNGGGAATRRADSIGESSPGTQSEREPENGWRMCQSWRILIGRTRTFHLRGSCSSQTGNALGSTGELQRYSVIRRRGNDAESFGRTTEPIFRRDFSPAASERPLQAVCLGRATRGIRAHEESAGEA